MFLNVAAFDLLMAMLKVLHASGRTDLLDYAGVTGGKKRQEDPKVEALGKKKTARVSCRQRQLKRKDLVMAKKEEDLAPHQEHFTADLLF